MVQYTIASTGVTRWWRAIPEHIKGPEGLTLPDVWGLVTAYGGRVKSGAILAIGFGLP